MSKPKAFYSYMENEDKLNILSDEQAGRLYKSLYAFCRTGEKPDLSDDPLLNYAFTDFLIDIERDQQKYEEKCEKRAEAGKKGGLAKQANAKKDVAKQANATFATNEEAKSKQNVAKPSKSSQPETEAETEAEFIIEKEINKERENPVDRDFDGFANMVLNEFNTICVDLPKATQLTMNRKRLLFNDGMMDRPFCDYHDLFKKVHTSDRLCGRSGLKWRADFDWVIKNRVKIMEGSYDNIKPPDKRGGIFSADNASFDIKAYEGKSLFND